MRQIVLDTETTGLEVSEGHRVIEIGGVEIINRRLSGKTFHHYLNPDREVDVEATGVHGMTREDLADKPRFADIADEFVKFVRDAELVIHNAPFDIGFLDNELRLTHHAVEQMETVCRVLDTLMLARRMHPGRRNSLDALCKRYDIDNTRRDYHGALLDAEILADVYLAMTGGQASLTLQSTMTANGAAAATQPIERTGGAALPIIRASDDEMETHHARLESIDAASDGRCIWKKMPTSSLHSD